jgi:hypothetical protein
MPASTGGHTVSHSRGKPAHPDFEATNPSSEIKKICQPPYFGRHCRTFLAAIQPF